MNAKLSMNRFRKNTFDWPPQTEAGKYCTREHTEFSCPNRYGLSLATIGQKMIRSHIDHLLSVCRPAAVFRAIRAIVVSAFNRKSRLIRWSHVRHKVLKFIPSFADLNAATSIVFVTAVLLISASVIHISPRSVKAPCMRTIIGFLAIFALSTETILSSSVAIKIRSWFCDLAMTASLGYDLLSHDFSPFKKSCRLGPDAGQTAFGSLIIQTQIYGVNPQNELFFHTSSI